MSQQFVIPHVLVPFEISLSTWTLHILMVPLSEKRHRLYPHEIPEIIQGLFLHLGKLLEERKEEEKAKITFRTLFRLLFLEKGRPKYPEFSWNQAAIFIEIYNDDT